MTSLDRSLGRKGQSVVAAYEAIRTLIVRGRLGPGSRLVERELAEHLEMSRSPVRSALLRLQQEGYAASTGGERVRLVVSPLTKADAQELYRILGFVDGEAAGQAALQARQARDDLVARMRTTQEAMDELAEATPFDAQGFFDLDTKFHHHYLDLAEAPRMMSLYRALRPQADRYRLFYTSGDHVGSLDQVSGEHQVIVEAIGEGDPEEARKAAAWNWERAAERVCAIMEIAGERGNL